MKQACQRCGDETDWSAPPALKDMTDKGWLCTEMQINERDKTLTLRWLCDLCAERLQKPG